MMQRTGAGPLIRRALIVDSALAGATNAAARSVHALVTELRARNVDVVQAMSFEDGLATVVSDSGIHCILLNWTQGRNDPSSHAQATDLLRAVRKRNTKVPIFLMASRELAGSVSVEVATLADEFIWILDDTASFIAGRLQASMERYLAELLPPFAAALARYDREREYSWAAPGHQGGVAFLKSPIGRVFFDFYGENLFRTDMGIERGALGSLLGHSGPVGESERYAARVFGAHRSYSVLNGTSASNRAIMSACVGDEEIALCDRNCHKSIEQSLVLTGGIPVFLMPTRNRYGIIGPIPPQQLEPAAIEKAIAGNPLAKATGHKRAVYSVLTNCTYDGMCYNAVEGGSASRKERRSYSFRRSVVWVRTLQSDVSRPLRHARQPRHAPARWPHGFRDAFDAQATRRAFANLLHSHSRWPRRDRSRPLQRSVLFASEYFAALCADCFKRCRGCDDGRPGRTVPHAGKHRRGCRLPPGGRAHPAGIPGEKGLVLRAVERRRGARPEERQTHSVSSGTRRTARHGPELLGAAPRRELARLRGPAGWLVHARSDQVRHRLSWYEVGWCNWTPRAFRRTS